jgi:hypothetical protein
MVDADAVGQIRDLMEPVGWNKDRLPFLSKESVSGVNPAPTINPTRPPSAVSAQDHLDESK